MPARPPSPRKPRSRMRVLAAVDASEVGRGAFDAALDLCGRLGAELHLVHARAHDFMAPDLTPGLDTPVAIPVHDEELHRDLLDEQRFGGWSRRAEDAGVPSRLHTLDGDPASSIVALARRLDADLLVVGTHGRKGLSRLVLGSTAEAIVRHADRPVLMVPIAARPRIPRSKPRPEAKPPSGAAKRAVRSPVRRKAVARP